MTEQDHSQTPRARHIDDIKPEEFETYCSVPAYRIWKEELHDIYSKDYETREIKLNGIRRNPLAIIVGIDAKGRDFLELKVDKYTSRRGVNLLVSTFNDPWYLLEPLDNDEVTHLDQIREEGKPDDLLRPVELRKILEEESSPMYLLMQQPFPIQLPSFEEFKKSLHSDLTEFH
jgi:hypothetical protein